MLSIIIPAYNEAKNIQPTVRTLVHELDRSDQHHELIVVCDGCTDDTAGQAHGLRLKQLQVLEYTPNHGKGYALTYGVEHSKGDTVVFLDAGGDFDPRSIRTFLNTMRSKNADAVIGSKRHPESKVIYPSKRQFDSRLYQVLIRVLFNLKISDTQAGLKMFKRAALEKALSCVTVERYAYDLELLVAMKQLGFSIVETPVILTYNATTSGLTYAAITHTLRDTFTIFWRLKVRRAYR